MAVTSMILASALVLGTAGEPAAVETSGAVPGLRVFLDCVVFGCDPAYLVSEVPFVDYVRDQKDSDVHAQVTYQVTGGGRIAYALQFLGRGEFLGRDDLLRTTLRTSDSADVIRAELARLLALGLAPYAAGTPRGKTLRVAFEKPVDGVAPLRADPWRGFVFSAVASGGFSGEQTHRTATMNSSFYASHITEDWKNSISCYEQYSQTDQKISTGRSTSIIRGNGANFLAVRSLGPNWSAGTWGGSSTSSYYNRKLGGSANAGIEYSFYPTKDSSRRRLAILYGAGVSHTNYVERTIFGKSYETLFSEELNVNLDLTQPWGTVSTGVRGSHYMHDWTKNYVAGDLRFSLRVVKGLSVDFTGTASLLHNQLYLARTGISDEEVLTQRRQLATSYQYVSTVGLTYTFGSIYNDVINPRFDR